ncbi:hypothetical protein [Aneurinibacillus migulanus]|uniref:Uncharacterized protein n=1 Tax=Aneurinibacillus migulanus TaxID=47500 RepID=A0A0D1YNQ3_ANEMI|nr:hypothetical protein [Aneurinibacillus migulanus]KIV60272.1 hypothetical protein TS65_00340 [Aneurinibacillus migulanus]KON90529.1 hypothetical protein AF333_29065 [Aneurinibacillus migulanus]MED0894884.1 hypothetical protein [Aneurinibacillus migulanus]MED1614472.1 hypothetical protein [Aneurinibacillus migulanus]SDJ76789.1 hypothetical protein SAMN04487909_12815 [Aneurinibacillus migulanus]
MSSEDVRKGITNAKFNQENSNILFGEIVFLAIFLGIWSSSWWVFGGIFLGCIIALLFKPLAFGLCICFGIAWGVIGYVIGAFFIENLGASVVLGIIGLLCGLGANLSALEWAKDIQ